MSEYESDSSDSDSSLEIVSKAKPVKEEPPVKPVKRAYTKKKELKPDDIERRRAQAEKMRKAKADKASAVKAEKTEKAVKEKALPVSVQRNGKKTRPRETIINNYYYSEPKPEPKDEPKPVLNIKPSVKPVARPVVPPTPKRNTAVFF